MSKEAFEPFSSITDLEAAHVVGAGGGPVLRSNALTREQLEQALRSTPYAYRWPKKQFRHGSLKPWG